MILAPPPVSRTQRQRLSATLSALPICQDQPGRNLLLQDLPPALVQNIVRSNAIAGDLGQIVMNVIGWGRLSDSDPIPAVQVLIENALEYAQESASGAELTRLKDELKAANVTAQQSSPASARPSELARLAPDPATILVVGAPQDQEALTLLARSLQLRGLRVRYDSADDPLSWLHRARLEAALTSECDAVIIWVSRPGLTARLLWESAVPTALARLARERDFPIIPVLQQVMVVDLPPAGESLSDCHPHVLRVEQPTTHDLRPLAQLVLQCALRERIRRGGGSASGLAICLHTFAYQPPEPLHLDLDWMAVFREGGSANAAPPATWATELLPALVDVQAVLARHAQPNQVRAWLRGRLSAMVALGYQFPLRKGALQVTWCQEDGGQQIAWAGRPAEQMADEELWLPPPLPIQQAASDDSLTLELAISRSTREVFPKVEAWLQKQEATPARRVQAWPAEGPSPESVKTEHQAQAWATQIGRVIRAEWRAGGGVHLFQAAPATFAALLGQHLYDQEGNQHPIYCYELLATSYTLACILGQS